MTTKTKTADVIQINMASVLAPADPSDAPIPSRPVMDRVPMFRAQQRVALKEADDALFIVDNELQAAAESHEARMELERQRYAVIRQQLDATRADVQLHRAGIQAGLDATDDKQFPAIDAAQ